jgi:hypothetical protein
MIDRPDHLNLKLQPPRSITINQRGDILEKTAIGLLTEN